MRFGRGRPGIGASSGHRVAASVATLATLAILAGVFRPAPASAHALLRGALPAAGSTLGTGPPAVTLTFSETPDLRLTSVKVLDVGGGDHVTGAPVALEDAADTVSVPIGELADGVYTVAWRTVSAVDGHISAGSFSFGVGMAAPTAPLDRSTGGTGQVGSPPAIVARWLLYLGLLGLLGAAFVAVAVARRPFADLLTMAAGGWVLAALGSIGVVGVQWIETGAPLETLPATSVGAAAFARLVSLLLVGGSLVALAVVPRLAGVWGWALVGISSAAALAVDVATGHAAAGPAWLSQIVVQWLHGITAATWLGGLAGLLVLLRSTPAIERLSTARRFSTWASVSLGLVALSGVVRAIAEVGSVDALVGTDFGRVVAGKSVLLLGLAGLGAFNRFVNLRDAARLARGLRRVAGAEIVIAVAVLGLSALLVNLSPPTSAGGPSTPTPRAIVASGNDFGTSVRLRLVATPGAAGANEFDAAIVDYDTGEPVDATRLELRFELASQAGVGPSTLVLDRAAPGRFRGSGSNLSIDGVWRIVATADVAGAGVEVPMLAVTSIAPQPVEALVSAGLPIIYQVQLAGIGSAQVYLDPGGAGPNELHVTFFDPAGSELPVETATIAAGSNEGGDAILSPRLLQPGHFVASIDALDGPLDVDAIAPLPDGAGQVHLRVTIEVQP